MSWARRWLDPLRSRWLPRDRPSVRRPIRGPLRLQLRLDDPYSYLAVQLLPQLVELLAPPCLPLQLELCAQAPSAYPADLSAPQWIGHALEDCAHLAAQHHFYFPAQPAIPPAEQVALAQQVLQRSGRVDEDFLRLLHNVLHMLWQGQTAKLRTVAQLAERQGRTAGRVGVAQKLQCHWSAEPLLQAQYWLGGRRYLAIDDFLRMTRRLQHQGALLREPVFLIDHVDWQEHLVSDPSILAEIQAQQPLLRFWGALEDPLTWLLLQYIHREMAGLYNLRIEFLPLPYQQRDQFDWALLRRLSQRTGVGFGPFCRPDAASALLMARYLCALDAPARLEAALRVLEAVWTQGRSMGVVQDVQRILTGSELPMLADEAQTEQWLRAHQHQMQQLHMPDQPVMQLQLGNRSWAFAGLYRVWRLEVLLAQAAEP